MTPFPSKSRYRSILDLDVIFRHIRFSPVSSLLSLDALMARTTTHLMIHAMTQPIEVLRADHDKAVFSADRQQLFMPTQRKTDKKKTRFGPNYLPSFAFQELPCSLLGGAHAKGQ
jgi:hypothetical protein